VIADPSISTLSKALSDILGSGSTAPSLRLFRLIADLAEDWQLLNGRIATVSAEIEARAKQDGHGHCRRLWRCRVSSQ